jgi:hypothetical protein
MAIHTLLNKGKPTSSGITRSGRIAVLIVNGLWLGLDTVAFARILQFIKAVV